MPRAGQDLGQGFANLGLVIDDKYRALTRVRLQRWPWVCVSRAHRADGQRNGKRSAPLDRRSDRERAAMSLDDAKAHRQSDSEADSCGLGGEIRLEYSRAKMRGNAGPVVCHRDADHVSEVVETAGHTYPPRSGVVLQGLLRVDDQVEHHLMELVGVGEYERKTPGEIERHLE